MPHQHIHIHIATRDAGFDESQHKRDHGKFTSGGGGNPPTKRQKVASHVLYPHAKTIATAARNFLPGMSTQGTSTQVGFNGNRVRVRFHNTDDTPLDVKKVKALEAHLLEKGFTRFSWEDMPGGPWKTSSHVFTAHAPKP